MASSSLGRLTLDLAVKIGAFEEGLTKAERKTKQTTENMSKAFSGFKSQISDALGGTQIGSVIDGFNSKLGSIKGNVLVAGAAIAGMAVGGVLVGVGALAKMSIEAAKADAQLQVLANRANTSVQNFQILEHAAAGLGVTQDQLGSILADVQEKLGEFSATKGGGAADFFDALKNNTKMTDDQIAKFGKTLQGKDGVEAIQMLNDKMDELGVTSQERRFVFESLASDLGNLAPLFSENGKLLSEYGKALEDAGILKTKESMEQSRILAAQTEALQIRYQGFKNQLTSQMMPVLNSVISQFMDGTDKSGKFGNIIQSVGVIAKAVGLLIIGLAASIKSVVITVSAFAEQAANIGITAQNVWNADGVIAKAKALGGGIKEGVNIAKSALSDLSGNFSSTLTSMSAVMDANAAKATDPLAQALLKTGEAAKQSATGLKLDTKSADENAKAKEKAAKESAKLAKEQAKLNGLVGASALTGLRIKSSEAFAGGQVRGYTANFAQLAQKQLGSELGRFTAFNDLYHKGTNSKHATGNAFDFTITDANKSAQAVSQLESIAKRYGYVVKILDEYKNPSSRATGGHLHVSVLGFRGAAEAAKQAQDELNIIAQTNEEADRIRAEALRAQQSVMRNYFSEEEKLNVEHAEKLTEIRKAFAGDDAAIKKYTELENAAYKKSVDQYKESLTQKSLEEKKQLLEVHRNWMTAADYAKEYYALVREEILNTAEYSPEMKNALIKQTNADQGVAENAERDQVWDDYKNRFDTYNPYQADMDLLAEARAQMLLTEEQYQQQRVGLQMAYGAQYGADFAGMMLGLVDSSSSAYALLGSAQKTFTLFSVGLSSIDAIGKAWASAPFPYNLPAVGIATMETGLLQAAISALSPVGMAHNGIDNIPKEGTWLLDGGERVLNPQQNKDLTNYLASKPENGGANINLNPNFVLVDERESLSDYLFSPDGTKAFVKFFKRNRSALGV